MGNYFVELCFCLKGMIVSYIRLSEYRLNDISDVESNTNLGCREIEIPFVCVFARFSREQKLWISQVFTFQRILLLHGQLGPPGGQSQLHNFTIFVNSGLHSSPLFLKFVFKLFFFTAALKSSRA